jgi:colanic acid biosynthesis glycosyl transferase WcaI
MNKRIAIQDYAGHPFQVQLSRKLAERGHNVLHLYAGYNQTPHGLLHKTETDPRNFEIQGLNIRSPLDKYSFVKRRYQEREYGHLVLDATDKFKPDTVISANMPLDPQAMLEKYCQKNKVRFVFWLQDVISLATKGILTQKLWVIGWAIGIYYLWLERRILSNSDQIIVITKGQKSLLQKMGIAQTKMTVIPNWAPLDELPIMPKDNPWSLEHGLADKFTFLYSGTLGLKHNPNLLLQIAQHFKDNPQVRVLVCSEGPGAEWLSQRKKEFALTNLIVMGYQPFEKYPQVLAAGDVLIAILETEAEEYSVPSKVLSYLTAQRPLLLAVPPSNLAAQITLNHQAGYVIHPSDITGMVAKCEELLSNQSLRKTFARNARLYAEGKFNIEHITDRFEAVI